MRNLKTYKIFENNKESMIISKSKEIERRIEIVADCLQEIFDDYSIVNRNSGEDFCWHFSVMPYNYIHKRDKWVDYKIGIHINNIPKDLFSKMENDIKNILPEIINRIDNKLETSYIERMGNDSFIEIKYPFNDLARLKSSDLL